MLGPGHPYFRPPPPKPGLSPLVIVLISVGAVLVVGGGACVVVGGLVLIGASADSDPASGRGSSEATTATGPGSATVTPGVPTATADAAGTSLAPIGEDNEAPSDPAEGKASSSAAPTARASSGGSWWCTASGSVRVCGFAGACNNQMVFGNAGGKDRVLAAMQAKSICEGMARAKGGSTVCIVQCTLR